MTRKVQVDQADIEVKGQKYIVTHIPTATSGSWYTVHDLFEVWGAVAIDDLSGEIIGWRNPPHDEFKVAVEEAIKKAFNIPGER